MVPARIEVAPARPSDRRLVALGAFFAGGVGVSALYAATGVGFFCPFRLATGWDCPLCGATRMGAALLRGDLASAWVDNPLVLLVLAVLALVGLGWVSERLGGPRLRLPRAVGARLSGVHPTRWLAVGLAVGVVYTLARNLT